MNYWLLTTEYPPFFGGGISTYCYHTASMLTAEGHQVTVFVKDKGVTGVVVQQLPEARIIRFNKDHKRIAPFLGDVANLSYEFAMILKEFIEKDGKPDMIESQDYNGIAYFLLQFRACLEKWCQQIPILITMHSPSFLYLEYNQVPVYKRPHFWIGEMERFCIQAADLVISPSQYLIDELKTRFPLRTSGLHVVPNPYRSFEPSPGNAYEASPTQNNDFTFYGKLSPQKGTFRVLEEFKKMWDRKEIRSFTMIGGEDIVFHPLAKTMGAIVREQYRDYIQKGLLILKDSISPLERASVLKGADLFIVPSIVDNLPYVVLELMALGKILIVSAQGGQSEVIADEVDGFIFDYNKPADFEIVLQKILKLSPEQRLTIAANAVKKIKENYSYKTIYPVKNNLLEALRKNFQAPDQFPFIRTIPSKDGKLLISGKLKDSLLSVIIPFYNLGKYLPETVASILNSTYKQVEIIIVNDGSTEPSSIEALNAYRSHAQIKIIDKKNTGLADSRNTGAELANGKFLSFLDADDTIATTYYEKAIRLLTYYKNVHFVGAWTQYFGSSSNIWPTFNPEPPLILTHNSINSSSLVYKTEAFLQAGKNDTSFKIGLEDYESVIQLKANGFNGVAIPEILFHYRVRKNSMIKKSNDEVRAAYYNKIRDKHEGLYTLYKSDIENINKWNGPPLSLDNSTLDDLPFQSIPVVGAIVRKIIPVLKSYPTLKNAVLAIKRGLHIK